MDLSCMKIIQSFWSKPFISRYPNDPTNRSRGGWISERIFLMSFALSCLRLKEFYKDVELVTDSIGKQLLIDYLGLPYSKYSTELESISEYHQSLWAIGKLYTYSLQQVPFLHVDNDVFIWHPFENRLLKSDIIAQNQEGKFKMDYYEIICREIREHFTYIPDVANKYVMNNGEINGVSGYNAGIFGGRDFSFFRELSQLAFNTLSANELQLNKINLGLLNMFLEQSLFFCLSLKKNKSVSTMLDRISPDFRELLDFSKIPSTKYIHTVGDSKRLLVTNEQVYLRLKIEYPFYFDRINDYCNEQSGLL